jgi:hypothetical protein
VRPDNLRSPAPAHKSQSDLLSCFLDAQLVVSYALVRNGITDRPSVVGGFLLLTLFVGTPIIAASIGYAAWKGRPKTFNRDTFVLAFLATVMISGFLIVYAQRMHADVRTWQYLLQFACFELGVLLLGIAGGFAVGIFTHRSK